MRNKHIVIPPNPSSGGGGGPAVDPATAKPLSVKYLVQGATPSITGDVGTSTKYAREDHTHTLPRQVGGMLKLAADKVMDVIPNTNILPMTINGYVGGITHSGLPTNGFFTSSEPTYYLIGATFSFESTEAGTYDVWVDVGGKRECRESGTVTKIGTGIENWTTVSISTVAYVALNSTISLKGKFSKAVTAKPEGTTLYVIKAF